jgi:prepilin-type N-terminal cleavage/methylation domain-containing protein
MPHRRHGRSAFTLVELLVVIGIIAVLISILLPALGLARRHAQDVICESNFRQFGMAIQIYCNNGGGFLPQKGPDGSTAPNAFGPVKISPGVKGYDDDTLWFNALPPLIDNKSYYEMLLDNFTSKIPPPSWENNKSIFTCPLMGRPGTLYNPEIPNAGEDYYSLFGIDSTGTIKSSSGLANAGQFPFDMVYVWNSKLQSRNLNLPDMPALKIDSCQPASAVVLMTEKIANYKEYLDEGVQNFNTSNPLVYTGKISQQGWLLNVAQPKSDWTRFTTRHHGGGFLLFADGHVQWYGWSGVQFPASQLANFNSNTADANQYGEIVWSVAGPVN